MTKWVVLVLLMIFFEVVAVASLRVQFPQDFRKHYQAEKRIIMFSVFGLLIGLVLGPISAAVSRDPMWLGASLCGLMGLGLGAIEPGKP